MSLKIGLLAGLCITGFSQATPNCNLVLDKCPRAFTTGTVTVPQNVIWLDPVVPICEDTVQVSNGGAPATPSIVFILDNSGSMADTDPEEARFRVTITLLDSIYKAQPATKVGIVVFTRRLAFDHREDSFFKTAFPNDTTQHDSYIPLTALNQVFANGHTGLDTLKELLSYDNSGQLKHVTKLPSARVSSGSLGASDTRNGTDITLGFEAAKQALIGDNNSHENQYFIFLSDGTPSTVDSTRVSMRWDWVKGIGAPTTFTVFFGNDKNSLDSLGKMNTNIRGNGYSTGNDKSNLWAIDLPASQLLGLLSKNVLVPIFAHTPVKATSGVMTVNGVSIANTSADATSFTFGNRVALNADQTTVNLVYTYAYTDSTKPKTITVPYIINIKRSGTDPLASGLSATCAESAGSAADISLFYQNQPITRVTADHDSLDVHLTLPSGQACANCKVQVTPSKSPDKETISLNPIGSIEAGTFKRETSNTPAPGDGTLQNLPSDSIVITWINPDNALDVVRKAFPYSDITTALQVLQHNDVAKALENLTTVSGQHFILIAPSSVNPVAGEPGKNWGLLTNLNAQDSASVVGIDLEASRAFRVVISIWSNLGQFVNKIDFSITQAEFEKLSKGLKNNTRKLSVLWDNRAQDGTLAGPGAYILKTEVTLLKIPGIAEDQVIRSDYRIVGVLRKH